MARGITSFRGYSKTYTPGGTRYSCVFCKNFSFMRQRGNALAMHNKAVGSIKAHVEKHHPERMPKPKPHKGMSKRFEKALAIAKGTKDPETPAYDGRYSRPIKIF